MALQDLTPQLRTRLSRMERAVGWFVMLAFVLLAFGFVYYIYTTAERKGWFLTKAPYFTFVSSATGLREGDPVMLMGFEAGRITQILPMPGDQFVYNVYVKFELKRPNYGYIWTEGSQARIATADLLGKRMLEVTKGSGGYPTYIFYPILDVSLQHLEALRQKSGWRFAQEIPDLVDPEVPNLLAKPFDPLTNAAVLAETGLSTVTVLNVEEEKKSITAMWDYRRARYITFTNNVSEYWLPSEESPPVTERLEAVVHQVESALPGVFALTNELRQVLTNSTSLISNLNIVAAQATPAVNNLAAVTAQLAQPGALGEWLIPTNINRELESTLANASSAMQSANTNLTALVNNLLRSLDNLASITSNLNQQVEANTNILSGISEAVTHTDELVQGLKRHWLLRSAFKEKKPRREDGATNGAPTRLMSPKERAR